MSTTASNLHVQLCMYVPQNSALFKIQTAPLRALVHATLSATVPALSELGLPYSNNTEASEYGTGYTLFHKHAHGERQRLG